MTVPRMTTAMRRSLEGRLANLGERIATLAAEVDAEDSLEHAVLMRELMREQGAVLDALRDARLIDDDDFDFDATEIGDVVTIEDVQGTTERYVLVDEGVGTRARSDWVSVRSPLGAAILGRGKGDRIEVNSPQGPMTYVIVGFERASEDGVGLEGLVLQQPSMTPSRSLEDPDAH